MFSNDTTKSVIKNMLFTGRGLATGPHWGGYSAPDPHVYSYPPNISGSATFKELDE